jgi:hypothetical protein
VKKQSFISRLTSALKGDSSAQLVKDIFRPIEKSQPQLAIDLASFCISGEPAAALAQARALQVAEAESLFGPIASTRWYSWNFKENASSIARVTLIHHYSQEKTAEPLLLIRIYRALAELLSNKIEKHAGDDFPDWLHLLITDWLYHQQERTYPPVKRRLKSPPLNLEQLRAICTHEDLDQTCWLPYYIERHKVSSYWGYDKVIATFDTLQGLRDFLLQNRDHLQNRLYPALSAAGKSNCLRILSEQKLCEAFAAFIARQAVASSKTVRNEAKRQLTGLPAALYRSEIEHALVNGNASERKAAAEFIGCTLGSEGQSLLQAALEREKSKSVASAIEIALGGTEINRETDTETTLDIPDYEKPNLSNRVSDEVIETLHRKIEELQEKQRQSEAKTAWEKDLRKEILGLSRNDAVKVVRVMNGEGWEQFNWHSVNRFMNDSNLFAHPSIDLINVLRLLGKPKQNNNRRPDSIQYGPLPMWLPKSSGRLKDLRALDDALKILGWPEDTIEQEILHLHWGRSLLFRTLPKEGVWPFFAQHAETLTAAIAAHGAGKVNWEGISMDRVLEVLACFPTPPGQVRASLLHLALSEGKTYRQRAQALLHELPGIEEKIASGLKSTAQESRINATRWLQRLASPQALTPLREALAKESREAVRATLLSALESLGEDISAYLNPETLLKEANKGLKKRIPKSLEWFPFDALPQLQWQDGEVVDPALLKWWVIIANKLKDPGANELLLKYLQRLSEPSRQILGLHLLRAFIAQDTLTPSVAEADSTAAAKAPGLLQQWQRWTKYDWGKEYQHKTLEDAHAAIRAEVLSTYLGSAIQSKGILSLCAYAPGADVVELVRAFMKEHYTRRAQIEAMLKALAQGDDSHVIQLLLSVARRYRTRSVQATARTLVDEIAERNGWSQDELADRTLPTAGFDEQGEQTLDYGSRQFTLSLDDKLKPLLKNPEGKVIKSLPAPRQADDPAQVKEAKAGFSACKKELKQVIQATSSRLYESMCSGRIWPLEDWKRYLLRHPIGNRLIQRLLWIQEAEGQPVAFRPTEDGALIDTEDEEVTLDRRAGVRLLHRTLLSDQEAEAWSAHIKDYGVDPLFEQIGRPVVSGEGRLEGNSLDLYQGYLSDSFTLRGLFTKLGYQRGEAEDGGFFYYYQKEFASLGLRAVIQFTGNCLPEENVAAALTTLGFTRLSSERQWFNEQDQVRLKEVPPILLSEVLADYKALADKSGGYDAEWQKKIPW